MRTWMAWVPLVTLVVSGGCSEADESEAPNVNVGVQEAGALAPPSGSDSGVGPSNTPVGGRSDAAVSQTRDGGGAVGPVATQDASTQPLPMRDAGASDAGMPPARLDAGFDAGSPGVVDAGRDSGPPPVTNPAYPPIVNGCNGFATRYWDCCKPHCGWSANVMGSAALATCNKSDGSLGSDFNVQSACPSGGGAYMCQGLAPWAINAQLSYGYAAVAARGDICGKCYQLQFTGRSRNAGDDPGSAALSGKTLIVQATNVGGDVGSGQFDLLIPGGGVGMYNACSSQWGVSSSELGAQYGGFLAACKQSGSHDAVKSCVMQRCSSVFGARGLTKLEAGCRWFVEWFQVADNPALQYKEVPCPQELKSKGMNRSTSGSNACGV